MEGDALAVARGELQAGSEHATARPPSIASLAASHRIAVGIVGIVVAVIVVAVIVVAVIVVAAPVPMSPPPR